MPWHDIREIPPGLDPERPIAVICAAGVRAATAASLLMHYGAARAIHVIDGGVSRLALNGLSLEESEAAV